MIRIRLLKKKKGGEGISKAWWPKECSNVWWPKEGEGKGSFSPLPTFPPKQFYLDLHFFSFDIKVLFHHGSRLLFTHFLPFPWPINYDCIF
jgi:hypothetical protein